MAYIDTPATERADFTTTLSEHNIDFSFAQPFGSPSKNPAESLRNQMRGLRANPRSQAQAMQTPRVRNTLLDKRNPPGMQKQEFTPLLKSAKRRGVMHTTIPEEKENSAIPATPREFKSSFISHTPGLPIDSSMLDGEETTGSMLGGATPAALVESSSLYDSTPIPSLDAEGRGVVLDQGNVLTLRDQEAKLDQMQKENFGLKLKIHYLEEALSKTGSEFHKATMKENVELKTAKFTLEHEMKKQRKRLFEVLQQLEELKVKYEETRLHLKERPVPGQDQDELNRLRRSAEENQRLADEREQELEDLREKLEEAAKPDDNPEELQKLRDEIGDLEADMRDRERQLEEKDEQIESLQEQVKEAGLRPENTENFQQDVEDLKIEVEQKKDAIQRLQEDAEGFKAEIEENRNAMDQLEENAEDLKAEIQQKQDAFNELQEDAEDLKTEIEQKKDAMEQLQEDAEDLKAEIEQKDNVIAERDAKLSLLEERMNSAYDRDASTKKLRGDVTNLETQLRERSEALDDAEERIRTLDKTLRQNVSDIESKMNAKTQEFEENEEWLKQELREAESARDARATELKQKEGALHNIERELADKDGEIQALQERLRTARGSWDAEAKETDARIQERDDSIKEREMRLRDKAQTIAHRDQTIIELQARFRRAEDEQDHNTSKQTRLLREQGERIGELQEELRTAKAKYQSRIDEKDGLAQSHNEELQALQTRFASLKSSESAQVRQRDQRVSELESSLKQKEAVIIDQSQQMVSLKSRLGAMETPSRKDSLIKQQAEQVRILHQQLQKVTQDKDQEMDDLEQQLQECETENAGLRSEVEVLKRKTESARHDHSLIGHKDDDLHAKQNRIMDLEDELNELRIRLQTAVDQRQFDVRNLERELDAARKNGKDGAASVQQQLTILRTQLETKHAQIRQDLEDELLVLESNLEQFQSEKSRMQKKALELEGELQRAKHNASLQQSEGRSRLQSVEIERDACKAAITSLESRLDEALKNKPDQLPFHDRKEPQLKLREAEIQITQLERQIAILESDLENAQQEKTLAEERMDLHEMLRQSKIEAEQLQISLLEKDKRLQGSTTREAELRAQVTRLGGEQDDLQAAVTDAKTRLQTSMSKEKELKVQLKQLREGHARLVELEEQIGERQGSSSDHARKEAELRTQLREAKAEIDDLRLDVEEKDAQLQTSSKKERELRERLRRARLDETLQQNLHTQMTDAEAELQALQQQLHDRAVKLRTSLKREQNLREKISGLERAEEGDRTILAKQFNNQLTVAEKKHASELKGLVRQIQYLRARCSREETFRSDLVFTKKWFLMQIEMYNQCNQADLRLLEDMGITPDVSFRQKKHSLKSVGLMVLATVRMQRLQKDWAGNRKLHESLVKKLEGMRKGQGKGAAR